MRWRNPLQARKNLRTMDDKQWNFAMVVLNGVTIQQSGVMLHPGLVMVVFLSQLTENPVILGMPMALWSGGFMLSQLVVSGYVQSHTRLLPIYKAVSLLRIGMWVVLFLGAAFIPNTVVLLGLMLFFLVGYPLSSGVSALAFFEVVSKTIPPRLRGTVFSWRQSIGGVIALGTGWFVNRMLAESFGLHFPQNFAVLFGVGTVVVILSMLCFFQVREPDGEVHRPAEEGLRGRWHEIKAILLGDRLYRHYVVGRVALLVAISTSPLIIVYAQKRYDLPLSAAGTYLVVDTITGLLVVALSGWLSTRIGNRKLALLSLVLGGLAFGLIVLTGWLSLNQQWAFLYFALVFILLAAHTRSNAVSFMALQLNIPPEGQRPLYIGFANTIFGLAAYLTIAQGVLVTLIGYLGLFMLALVLILVSLWQIGVYVYDPSEVEDAGLDEQRYVHA